MGKGMSKILVKPEDAARELGITVYSLKAKMRLHEEGKLKAFKIGEYFVVPGATVGRYFIYRKKLDKYKRKIGLIE